MKDSQTEGKDSATGCPLSKTGYYCVENDELVECQGECYKKDKP